MRNTLKFITWPAIAGLLAALLILDRLVLPEREGTRAHQGRLTPATPER